MQQAATYRERSRELLANARAELDTDLAQAGEKGWGAAASIVKAVAEERGLFHRGHRGLSVIVEALEQETGDEDIRRGFAVASDLHINFYENQHSHPWMEASIEDIERFVGRVEALLSSGP